MFALLSRLSPSRKAPSSEQTMPAPRAASIETLEDRRLHSVSPAGEATSFSWGESQTGTSVSATLNKASPKLMLASVQQPEQSQIIAILIGL